MPDGAPPPGRLTPAFVGLVVAVVVSLSHAVLALHGDVTPPELDEMTLLGAGARLASGELPYRDVHVHVPPLLIGWHALLHALVGPALLLFRGAALLAWTLAWLAMGRALVRRAGSGPAAHAVGVACLAAAWAWAWWPHSYPHWWGVLAFLGFVACELGLETRPRSRAISALWCASILVMPLVDQPVAFVGLLVAAVMSVARLRSGEAAAERRRLGGLVAGAAGLVALLAAAGMLVPLVQDTVLWPLTSYRQPGGTNDVPTPLTDAAARIEAAGPDGGLPVTLAVVGLLLLWPLAMAFAWVRRRSSPTPALVLARAMITLTPLAFLPGRNDLVHVAFLAPLVLLGVALARAEDARTGFTLPGWAQSCEVAAIACGLLAMLAPLARSASTIPPPDSWLAHDAEWDEDAVIGAARMAAEENGGSLAVLGRGGRMAFHDVPSPLPWLDLLPRSAGYGADAERDAAAEILAADSPRWVMLYPRSLAEPFLTEEDALGRLLRARWTRRFVVGEALMIEQGGGEARGGR